MLVNVNGLINTSSGFVGGATGGVIVLTSSTNPSTVGGSVTFTAKAVTGYTGTVQFKVDGVNLGSAVTLAGSPPQAVSIATSSLTGGPHAVTASYSGNKPSEVASLTQVVNLLSTTTTLGAPSPASPQNVGTPISFTATVGGGGTGTVTFFSDGVQIGSPQTISAGSATLSGFTGLSVGTHSITARYDGDATHAQSTATAISYQTTLISSTVAVTSDNSSSTFGAPVVFTATITTTGAAPTGTVQFFDGGSSLGSATVSGTTAVLSPVTSLSIGTHSITAVYSGDSSHAVSPPSPAFTQTVNPAGGVFPDNTTSANEYLILFV